MKGKIALMAAVAILAMPLLAMPSDGVTGLIGEGSNDSLSVSYHEHGYGVSVITFTEKPSCETADLVIIDSDLRNVSTTRSIPVTKVMAVEHKLLSIGTYTYIITDGATGSFLMDCDVLVHEPSQTTYMVSFDPNGGSGAMVPLMVTDGKAVLPANGFQAPSGKSFGGWDIDGTQYQPGAEISVSADITVKAVWGSGASFDMAVVIIAIAVLAALLLAVVVILRRRSV